MSDDLDVEDGVGGDYKMELKSKLRSGYGTVSIPNPNTGYNDSKEGTLVLVNDVLALLLETYIEARNVGWETVALDALAEKVREASQQ